jgi:hypothetical protein
MPSSCLLSPSAFHGIPEQLENNIKNQLEQVEIDKQPGPLSLFSLLYAFKFLPGFLNVNLIKALD